jgi:ribonuclease BN (tRNA processing enzyme)
MDDTRFEVLEQLNAQVDIWIDQEEFDRVASLFKFAPVDKKSADNDFENRLENAFSHEYCTYALDKEWDILLNISLTPLIQFRLSNNKRTPFHKNDPKLEDKWARFFWAKLIRAKIQQKGSDCYFNRLDQLVVFLERNQPVVKRNSDKTNKLSDQVNKLSVIYLLEMAAAGEGADQRSFAERARRILREHFKGKNGETACFYDFYDLLARYTIGLGFQHEGRSRDAVLEFNWIIKELRGLWNDEGKLHPVLSADKWVQYVDKRYGLEYLYLPAVLGRTGIEIKLQLAYHALETINNYWENHQHPYLTAKKEYLFAEANRLMSEYKTSQKNLQTVAEILIKKCQTNSSLSGELPTEWKSRFEQINTVCRQKWANIQGRLLDTYVALQLDELKKEPTSAPSKSLESVCEIFSMYWKASKWQTTNRVGYLESVAAYLGWVAEIKTSDNDDANQFDRIAKELYKENKEYLIPEKQDDGDRKKQPSCLFCTKLGIKLERLGSSHYQEFVKNMRTFYREFKMEEDSKRFRDQIFETEKEHREDSAYQKREMAMDQLGDDEGVPIDWCKKCIQGEKETPGKTSSFSGLLHCADSHEKKNDNQSKQEEALSLDKKHYEHLMDHWDKRFLKHLEIESAHLPRCNTLHLLGLQRWNSTSPAIGRSLGGGYLIYHTNEKGRVDLGVAVDPGFDFVRNLFHSGFSLSDIDVVLLSHAHLDHIRDFESLVTLCLELNKRHPDKVKRRLHTIMTLGVYRRLSHIFESPDLRECVEPYILDIKKEINPTFVKPYIHDLKYYKHLLKPHGNDPEPKVDPDIQWFVFQEDQDRKKDSNTDRGRFRFLAETVTNPKNNKGLRLSVTATRAYHNDFSEYSDSFGFKIKISADGREADACTIGYTGDTSWSHDIIEQYKNCNALLVHLGSLINRRKDICFDDYIEGGQKCWNLIKEKNHPYLFGLLQFLTEIADQKFTENGKVPLVLLSEFGEELRGRIRLDLYNRLSAQYNGKNALRKIPLLPLDIGLDVILAIDDAPKDESEKGERDCTRLRTLLKNNDSPFLVKCVVCEEFVVPKQVDFETYGHDEGLYCVCEACRISTPQNVLQDKLRDLYEVARPLQSCY